MDNQEYRKVSREIKNYKVARMNVVGFIAFTVLNIFMLLFADRYFLFSIYTSVIFFELGLGFKLAAAEAGAASPNAYLAGGIALGLVVLAAFFVVWLFSKKHRWAMIVLFALFAFDTAVVTFGLIFFKDYTMIIDLAIHGVMLYYLILGVKSSDELQKHFPEGVNLTPERLDEAYRLETGLDPVTGAPVNGEAGAAAAPVEKIDKPDSPVLEEDTTKKRAVLEAAYNGAQVKVKLSVGGKASLIVDGKVYAVDKMGGAFKCNKKISAVVNGVEYTYEYDYRYPQVNHYLYADNRIIAQRGN